MATGELTPPLWGGECRPIDHRHPGLIRRLPHLSAPKEEKRGRGQAGNDQLHTSCVSCMIAVMAVRVRLIFLNFAALAIGTLVAVVSVASYRWLLALPEERAVVADGGSMMISAADQATISATFAALAALPIIAVCLPIWLILAKFRKNTWAAAAALGFASTVGAWIILFDLDIPLSEALVNSLPYGLCGALAGVTTWWTSPGRREIAERGI